jgi:hypothetical protein
MARIGRNDPCPCGSGLKFKKCCLRKEAMPAQPQAAQQGPPSITREIEKIQRAAADKKSTIFTIGVFILFSTEAGEAWLLEVTDMDAIQVASAGEKIPVEIEESAETIEINWTHKFAVKDKKVVLTSYKDNLEEMREDFPAHSILSFVKKIIKRIPPEVLSTLHVPDQTSESAGS